MLNRLRSHWESIIACVLVAAATIAFFKLCRYIDRPVVDDALISIGYARTFADGDGLRPTAYSEISEGFSNPTWTLLLALFEKLHFNTIATSKTLGMILGALSLPLVAAWGPLSQRRKIQVEDAIAPAFACTNATFAYWCLGGLETGLLVFAAALFGVFLFAPRTRRSAIGAGLSGAALALTRPEAPLYLGAIGLPWFVDWAATSRGRPSRSDLLFAATLVGPIAAYFLFRRAYFGSWWPNTYYAKASWTIGLTNLEEGTRHYLSGFRDSISVLCTCGVIGLACSLFGGAKTARAALASALVAIAMFFFAWYARADWMKEWRFLAPTLPFIAFPIAAGAAAVRELLAREPLAGRRKARLGVSIVVIAAVLFGLRADTKQHGTRWREVKNEGGDTPRVPDDRQAYGSDVRNLVADFKMTHPFIAGPDMGFLSVGLRNSEILDLAGLTDVTIARHYGNKKALHDYLTHEGYPSVLMLWGPSGWVYGMSDVMAQYKPGPGNYASYKIYAKVTPDTDERCPDGKEAAMKATVDEMKARISADLDANDPVKALFRWRCYFAYRTDADLISPRDRRAIADRAARSAKEAAAAGHAELALRNDSLCAVIASDVGCRMKAERIRAHMFPRKK